MMSMTMMRKRATTMIKKAMSTFVLRCKAKRDYAEQSFKESVQYYIEAGLFWLIMALLMAMCLGMVPPQQPVQPDQVWSHFIPW